MKIKRINKEIEGEAKGMLMATEEKGGIPAMDIDGRTQNEVEEEIIRLQKKFKLGNVCLVKSSENSWHVLPFWNHLKWSMVIKIINDSPLVDERFKEFRDTGKIRIRISKKGNEPKPKIIEIMGSRYHRANVKGQFKFICYRRLLQ